MKRKIVFIVFAIVMVMITVSCTMTQKCPAYADNNIITEQKS